MFEPNSTTVELTEDGDYRIDWRTCTPGCPVTVFSGLSVENMDLDNPLLTEDTPPAVVSGLSGDSRRFFYLCAQDTDMHVVAERRLPLDGAKNFRDLGGYLTRDGRQVKWGMLYRSGRLSELTETDRQYFSGLNITRICDFRREDEQVRSPSRLPEENNVTIVDLPIEAGSSESFQERIERGKSDRDDMMGLMNKIYLDFAENQSHRYAGMFHCLLENEDGANLIHCTAGKDRTGFGTALILHALGVADDTIMKDYLLTRRYFPIETEMRLMAVKYEIPQDVYIDVMRPVFEVHPVYLQTAMDAVEEKYGGIKNYMEEGLGLTREVRHELMDKYLET
jgi:protein-tyrosine phosphatase